MLTAVPKGGSYSSGGGGLANRLWIGVYLDRVGETVLAWRLDCRFLAVLNAYEGPFSACGMGEAGA